MTSFVPPRRPAVRQSGARSELTVELARKPLPPWLDPATSRAEEEPAPAPPACSIDIQGLFWHNPDTDAYDLISATGYLAER